jgi:hypothetical protein
MSYNLLSDEDVLARWQGVKACPKTVDVYDEESEWYVTAMPSMAVEMGDLTAIPAVGIWKRSWHQADSTEEEPLPQKGFFVTHASQRGVFVKSSEVSFAIEVAKEIFEEQSNRPGH